MPLKRACAKPSGVTARLPERTAQQERGDVALDTDIAASEEAGDVHLKLRAVESAQACKHVRAAPTRTHAQ
eukprot:8222841-Alexandrium_andersonii.AAC.1